MAFINRQTVEDIYNMINTANEFEQKELFDHLFTDPNIERMVAERISDETLVDVALTADEETVIKFMELSGRYSITDNEADQPSDDDFDHSDEQREREGRGL